jgi:hypothetical protein
MTHSSWIRRYTGGVASAPCVLVADYIAISMPRTLPSPNTWMLFVHNNQPIATFFPPHAYLCPITSDVVSDAYQRANMRGIPCLLLDS